MTDLSMIHPSAEHVAADDLPWADAGTLQLKVLQVRESEGLWVVQNRFDPGVEVARHRHTGPVYAVTSAGAWGYRENDFLNRAGSYLYEPANSVHTLYTPDDNTEVTDVVFVIFGANLNLDADGNVESVTDGASVLAGYYALLEAQGIARPNGILQ